MEVQDKTDELLVNHLIMPPCTVNTENISVQVIPETKEQKKEKYINCVLNIQKLFTKGYSKETGNELVLYLQKQRSLILELMLENFMNRPDPKMGDSLNTLMGQMEKSVRDDRKESIKAKEMETSRETFALFAKSLSAVMDGSLVIPDFGPTSLLLDPMKPLLDQTEAKIKPEELVMGNVLVDDKKIEQAIADENSAAMSGGQEISK